MYLDAPDNELNRSKNFPGQWAAFAEPNCEFRSLNCPYGWFEEEWLIVIDVIQGHLQELCGLIGNGLPQVIGQENELKRKEESTMSLIIWYRSIFTVITKGIIQSPNFLLKGS